MTDCVIHYIKDVTKRFGVHYQIKNKNDNTWLGYQPDIEYCCEGSTKFFTEHRDISIDLKVADSDNPQVEMTFVSSLGWYGDNDKESVIIRFCPFCGGKIKLVQGN